MDLSLFLWFSYPRFLIIICRGLEVQTFHTAPLQKSLQIQKVKNEKKQCLIVPFLANLSERKTWAINTARVRVETRDYGMQDHEVVELRVLGSGCRLLGQNG